MVKHNNEVPNQHFKKKWMHYVKTWFNQPARKVSRRNGMLCADSMLTLCTLTVCTLTNSAPLQLAKPRLLGSSHALPPDLCALWCRPRQSSTTRRLASAVASRWQSSRCVRAWGGSVHAAVDKW